MNPAAADHRVWPIPYIAFDAMPGTGTLVRLSVPLLDNVESRPGDVELASMEVTP